MFISEDLTQFKNLFVTQLKNMLSADELGAFILVLANSQQDVFLKNTLKDDIEKTFIKLKENFINGKLKTTQDDVDVFKKLLDFDIDDIAEWQSKESGGWQVVYNSMRQLRPARASSQILSSIKQNFDETRFHFNKPFLKPEILWQGGCKDSNYEEIKLRVLYNKFPFSEHHLLIIVSPEKNSPQLLTKESHQLIFSLVQKYDTIFPGFGAGFNSLAAGASVNHLHFQGFIRQQEFPIEGQHWTHNGGESNYPLRVRCFTDVESSWLYTNKLIDENIAFNCIYRANICYIVSRQYQGTVVLPDWLVGAGWLDVAGVITVSDENTFNSIKGSDITDSLMLLTIDSLK